MTEIIYELYNGNSLGEKSEYILRGTLATRLLNSKPQEFEISPGSQAKRRKAWAVQGGSSFLDERASQLCRDDDGSVVGETMP